MTSQGLAAAYLRKAADRLDVLDLLHRKRAYSDVVREAQEVVELALKGMLRSVGIEPPKFHDVGGLLVEHRRRYPAAIARGLARAAEISKRLRKERELAFYGDIDFIPTEQYSAADSRRAARDATWIVRLAQRSLPAAGKPGRRKR